MMLRSKTAMAFVSAAGLGVVLIGMGWQARPVADPTPGRIVADESEISWRSPVVEPGRSVASPKARFRLSNPGGQPVTITAIQPSCGCAQPVASAMSIDPGGVITLDVAGQPLPVGDRTVTINVRTDSAVTPTLPLTLRLIGSNKPPFLLDATGDLTFLNVDRPNLKPDGESRKLVVRMIETRADAQEPTFRATPPNLLVTKIGEQTQPYREPDTVLRMYLYRVGFAEPPIEDRLAGGVTVIDPWSPEHRTELRVEVEVRARIKAVPARIDLVATAGAEAAAEFLVLTDGTAPIAIEDYRIDAASPLRVEPIWARRGVARFRVAAPVTTAAADLTRTLTIHAAPMADESAVVSVTLRRPQP